MAKMIFEEKQRFNQWWIWLIAILIVGASINPLFEKAEIVSRDLLGPALTFGIILFFLFGIVLITRIDEQGVNVKMFPFHFSEVHYLWGEISTVEVTKYSPLWEYGGWGIRGFGDDKAFNIKGNIGIRIKLVSGKIRMIGTQKEAEAKAAIESYFSKEL